MWLLIMDLLQGVEWLLFVWWVSGQGAWRPDVEFLELLLGQLLPGRLSGLLTPEQTWLLERKVGGTALVLLDYVLVHDLMTWMFSLR